MTLTLVLFLAAVPVARADAPQDTVSLTPSLPDGQLVGTTITWTATSTGMGVPLYRFSVAPQGGPYAVLQDFSPTASFSWTPMEEGVYAVKVTAEDGFTATAPIEAVVPFTVASRVTGTSAVVTPMGNPLVALYSAPPCSQGQATAMFRAVTDTSWTYTAAQPCQAGLSLNFLVAGMRANTTYIMQHVVNSNAGTMVSAPQSFTTGAIPSSRVFPSFSVPQPPTQNADLQESTILHMMTPRGPGNPDPVTTDLNGNIVWYYDPAQSGLLSLWPTELVPGGSILLFGQDANATSGFDILREVDLAGNTLRETNLAVINAQLALRGQEPEPIYTFHHDAERLPNGDTAIMGMTQPTSNLAGDMLIVLDPNFQVVWTWDARNYLDPNRVIDPTSCAFGDGTFCSVPNPNATDWTHTNRIGWSPSDNNITLSMRSQDWVLKIDYENGSGDGHVIWRLGLNGDFNITPAHPGDPYPWFSHQHDAHYIDDTTMAVFDNGNTRCDRAPQPCDSRGQIYTIDEQSHMATQLANIDLGNNSFALGAAERLPNGNYSFTSGAQNPGPFGQTIEVTPDGAKVYVEQTNGLEYRSYRLSDLYSGSNPALTPCTDPVACSTSTSTPTSTATMAAPTNTPVSAPSSTPASAPSSTAVAASSSTPASAPSSTAEAAPSNTPASAPSNTPVTPPTNTAVATATPPTATPSPTATHSVAKLTRGSRPPSHHAYNPQITLGAARKVLVGHGALVITVHTTARTPLALTIQITTPAAHPRRKARDILVYHARVRLKTGPRGRAIAKLHLAYNPRKTTQALLAVTVQAPQGTAKRSIRVTVRPAPHHVKATQHTSTQHATSTASGLSVRIRSRTAAL